MQLLARLARVWWRDTTALNQHTMCRMRCPLEKSVQRQERVSVATVSSAAITNMKGETSTKRADTNVREQKQAVAIARLCARSLSTEDTKGTKQSKQTNKDTRYPDPPPYPNQTSFFDRFLPPVLTFRRFVVVPSFSPLPRVPCFVFWRRRTV